jgi:hypothetical protein
MICGFFANSMTVSRPIPLEEPVTMASIFVFLCSEDTLLNESSDEETPSFILSPVPAKSVH